MKRTRLEVVYIKDPKQVKLIEETKLSKQKKEEFYYNQLLFSKVLANENQNSSNGKSDLIENNLEKGIENFNIDELVKNVPKPVFKGDAKTYPYFKEKKSEIKITSIRQSIFHTLGFSSSSNNKEENQSLKDNNQFPIHFNQKARIMEGFTTSNLNEITNPIQPMRLDNFLGQFSNEKEMENIDLNQLFDLDEKKLKELKEKGKEFIDATSTVINEKEKREESMASELDLLSFFNEKILGLSENDIKIQIVTQNFEKASGITYEPNGARIFFKKEK